MKHLKKFNEKFNESIALDYIENFSILEEFDVDGYKSHWVKFKKWLSEKDFELYDGEQDLHDKFIEVANNDDYSSDEKADIICNYLEDKWGLYGGYDETWNFLDSLLMDEI